MSTMRGCSAAREDRRSVSGLCTIIFDRSDPAQVRELAHGLARASGVEWETLTLLEIACWLRRACALADALLRGPWRGWSC
jgi:hypothetical protein